MTKPDALVLRGDGINCEEETVYALKLSQFNPVRVTCLDLKEQPTLLKRAQVIVFPGGFSFGALYRLEIAALAYAHPGGSGFSPALPH